MSSAAKRPGLEANADLEARWAARNEPTTALRVAAELARLRGVSPEVVAAAVRNTYRQLSGR